MVTQNVEAKVSAMPILHSFNIEWPFILPLERLAQEREQIARGYLDRKLPCQPHQ